LNHDDGQRPLIIAYITIINGFKVNSNIIFIKLNKVKLRDKLNLRNVKNLLFFVAPGDSRASGTIFLDDIQIQN
jgi:hypothetical protein